MPLIPEDAGKEAVKRLQKARSKNVREAWRSAASFGAVGMSVATIVIFGRGGTDPQAWSLVVAAGLAAFIVGYASWRWMVNSAGVGIVRRGILAGAVTGLLAHPLAWYLAIVLNYLLNRPLFPGSKPVDPMKGIWASIVYAFFSVILVGWLTVPAGALTGWILVRRHRK